MGIWTDFKKALGSQVKSLSQQWGLTTLSLPSHDHVPQEDRAFFDSRYADFLQRAHDGEAVTIIYSREEPDFKKSNVRRAVTMPHNSPTMNTKFFKDIEPNERYLNEFRKFLRSFEFDSAAIDQALDYAKALSKAAIPALQEEYAKRRAAFHQAKTSGHDSPEAP